MIQEKKKASKGVIIISNSLADDTSNIWERYFEWGYHQDILIDYIFKSRIYTKFNMRNASSRCSYSFIHIQELIYQLVNQDFIVMIYDSIGDKINLFLYLPPRLNSRQKENVENTLNKLGNPNLYVYELNEVDELFDYYKDEADEVHEVISLLEKKVKDSEAKKGNNLVRRPKKD